MSDLNTNDILIWTRVVGNTEPLGWRLDDNDGNPIDLTGLTLHCDGYDEDGDGVTKDIDGNTVTADGDQVNNKGQCSVQVNAADVVAGNAGKKFKLYVIDDSTPPRYWPFDGGRRVLRVVLPNQ